MKKKVEDQNKQYTHDKLMESHLDSNPIIQFGKWFEEASDADLPYPSVLTLATSSKDRSPSARMMLLKGFGQDGFIFYTNSESKKGEDLDENPRASMVFWWAEHERQVRIEGEIEKLPAEEIDSYFHSRPRGSQIGAWASDQSRVIESREFLDNRFNELEKKFEDKEIPRPKNWLGYRLKPNSIEFWQGRANRLHDRLRYRFNENGEWIIERLAP